MSETLRLRGVVLSDGDERHVSAGIASNEAVPRILRSDPGTLRSPVAIVLRGGVGARG